MTPFQSPKRSAAQATDPGSDYLDLAVEAGVKALLDAGLGYDEVDQGIGCFVYGDSTCGQRVFYSLGMTGIPIVNVNNWCSSGSTGLWLANQAIRSGSAHCVLVIGFDKMYPGVLPRPFATARVPCHAFSISHKSRSLSLSKEAVARMDASALCQRPSRILEPVRWCRRSKSALCPDRVHQPLTRCEQPLQSARRGSQCGQRLE